VRHPKSGEQSSPYSYTGLHRVIHERARLGVLTSLAVHPKGLRFSDLKQLSGLTDGNLSPQTFCKLTALGRKRYAEYVLVLERVVKDAAVAFKSPAAKRGSNPA
jgi:hypothetical protein